MESSDGSAPLIDPSLLESLTEEQRAEALAAAAAAKRAEERAEQRALERALARKAAQRQEEASSAAAVQTSTAIPQRKVVFVRKEKRNGNKQPQQQEQQKKEELPTRKPQVKPSKPQQQQLPSEWNEAQLAAVKQAYLGKSAAETEQAQLEQRRNQRSKKKLTFKFEWDNTDDTLQDDPLYAGIAAARSHKRQRLDDLPTSTTPTIESARSKPIDNMTTRDWRIFRENYDIVVKGGRAPPPMRSFVEPPVSTIPPIHSAILDAIQTTLKYKEPSPIQRQAIPIGLQRRDLIGVAETGSGKTAAFGIPLCHYLLQLPAHILERVASDGPLALVMAPTRELALQIDVEFHKLLSRQTVVQSCAIVGGQPIQQQAQKLRNGVHIVVGTPGRINECLEMAYLVLNQCCYIVLDEADRMIDMGFAPQMESILDAMGGSLKSEIESEAYQQELEDLRTQGLPKYRLTAMFSATMPTEVERMAKEYLRHPAIISIGDRDSGKNARITQRIIFLSSPSAKEKALRDLLASSRQPHEKILIFVNEKKHADGVGRMVERAGKRCVVMHGGKSQDQREENLDAFRKGGVVMVATDVAGRGLDIPDVSHVINYDLPTRSIDNYSHRIGRTGRAGKEGLATSFITDEDEGIMPALKEYLESTGNPVPSRLARHPAASVGMKGRNIT